MPAETLADVDIRDQLKLRPYRVPNFEAEDRALAALAAELAVDPQNMLQKIVETALVLCQADTAGISLLETQGGVELFHWEALAGVFRSKRHSTMPREASPCGVCINQNSTQLMYLADRAFPALLQEPRFVEALLIPFHCMGLPIGTVWVVTHRYDRKFDQEDERLVRTLAAFASAGWQLWKASEAKDEFIALLGHELRNPLAAIRSAMRAAQHPEIDTADREQALSVVSGQVEALTRLADDLLDVSRVSQGKLELVSELIDLRSVVRHAEETGRSLMDARGHTLTVTLPGHPITVYADPVRLGQMLTNLLDNAAKFTADGGQISLSATAEGNEAQIVVRDSGIGMSVEQRETIFKPFKQPGRLRNGSNRGLGLGLTLVERLAKLHGGGVNASSPGPGEGSEFVVRLPLRTAVDAVEAEPLTRSAITPRRILLVEDDTKLAYVFALELRLDGHEVRIAMDGNGALAAAEEFRPEVVLLDLGLPDMDGLEVARGLRRETEEENPLIVALTGHVQEQFRRGSKEAGCDYHLTKPVDFVALRSILAAVGTASVGGGAVGL